MKKTFCILIIILSVLLTACSEGRAVQLKNLPDYAAPLETALNALMNGNGPGYLSAFPEKMGEDYTKQDVYLYYYSLPGMSAWLSNSLRIYRETYGDGLTIKGSIWAWENVSVDSLGDANLDYHTYMRYVTEDNTQSVISALFNYTIGGEDSKETKEARLYFVKQNGKWYLHPCFAFYTF